MIAVNSAADVTPTTTTWVIPMLTPIANVAPLGALLASVTMAPDSRARTVPMPSACRAAARTARGRALGSGSAGIGAL